MIKLENFLKLKLQERVFVDMRCVNANLTISVNDIKLSVTELVRDATINLSIERITRLRRPELAWSNLNPARV